MTKHELLFALMALPDDATIMVRSDDGDEYVIATEVHYFDKTEDNTIWIS